MSELFQAALEAIIHRNKEAMGRLLGGGITSDDPLCGLIEAARYSLDSGGKRVRATLGYWAAAAVTSDTLPATDYASCALELIHTYSLIHDDLPAMDDDDLRRGKPSLHKAYDEATAILVGDGLQAKAFELLADAPELSAQQRIAMVKVLAKAAGPAGMVGGQFIDIQATDSDISLEQLKAMHSLKTGALIRASLALGGIAAGASEAQLAALDNYGTHIGLAFQVVDDILDVEGDTATLGKTQGKDSEANKPTYVKLMGLKGAKAEAQRLLADALEALNGFGESADLLRDLARYIVERDR
ncbi:Farnesyl diphosphate synthase [Halioglobus japonicus]|nr:Farnesyl diphosphate synthase [Halioglobus japonicus]